MNAPTGRLVLMAPCLLAAALAGTACRGDVLLPAAPSRPLYEIPELRTAPVLPSVLRGRVTEAPPTATTEIYQAHVVIVDGEHAGKSARTGVSGFYEIAGISPGVATVAVTADGFVGARRQVEFGGVNQTADFQLLLQPAVLRYVLKGDVRGSDGTCTDGLTQRPCRIVMFPVHHGGAIHARLDWTPQATSDLDLTLFKTDAISQPLMRSAARGPGPEVVHLDVDGGVNYQLHITYAEGTSPADYTLTLEYPN